MKKLILSVTIALGLLKSYGQELPQIISQTPEAATLGKYGNTPVSKYTGVPNISIPLYTIKEGDIEVPITLNYHAGGFKVQEDATWVGLGWSLTPGGMISRDPRGNADQFSNLTYFEIWGDNNKLPNDFISSSPSAVFEKYGISHVFRQGSHYPIQDMEPYFLKEYPVNGIHHKDLFQADHFNYSFPGGAGELYNRNNKELVDRSINLLKIERVDNNDAIFKITNTDGAIYNYGKNSGVLAHQGIDLSSFYTYAGGAPSSSIVEMNYYLTNITSPTGRKVDFYYENTNNGDHIISTTSVKQIARYIPGNPSNILPQDSKSIQTIETSSLTRKSVLSKIEFSQGYVLFHVNDNLNPREDIKGSGAKKLEAIEIYQYTSASDANSNRSSKLIKRFEFEYSYFTASSSIGYTPSHPLFDQTFNTKRLRLDRIKELGNTINTTPKVHEFAYNNTMLPPKTSYSVDKYGYYNGKRNFTFIPQLLITDNNVTIDDILNNRDISPKDVLYNGANVTPNPNVVNACLLEKITYPTKGSTSFQYEANEYFVPYTYKRFEEKVASNYSGGYENLKIDPKNITFTIEEETTVIIDWTLLSRNSSFGPNDLYVKITGDNIHGGYFKKWDFSTGDASGSDICEVIMHNGQVQAEQLCTRNVSIILPPGTYTVDTHNDIENIDVPTSDGNVLSIAEADILFYYKDYTDTSEYGPGVRIAEITDRDTNNTVISKKRYDYTKLNSEGKIQTSGKLLHKPVFHYKAIELENTTQNDIPIIRRNDFFYRTNTPKRSFSTSANGKMLGYDKVTEIQIGTHDNINGKIECEYHNIIDDIHIGTPDYDVENFPSLSSPLNGKLKKEEVFKSNGDNFSIVKSTDFRYKILDSEVLWYGIPISYVNKTLPVGPLQIQYTLLGHHLFPQCLYPEISTFVTLENKIEKIFNSNDENPITSTSNYAYENTQLSTETTSHSNGDVRIQHYFYPLSFFKPNWIQYVDEMVDKNMVANPIASTSVLNGKPVGTQTTDYKVWHQGSSSNNNTIIIAPEKVKIDKGAHRIDIETRVIYHKYDLNGNPLEVSKHDGMHISYIWGYNQQYPVAKIENATRAEIEALSGFGADFHTGAFALTETQEQTLRTNLPNAMITTFTYDPLIGITSITDPREYTTYYQYDEFNRLQSIKDANGNITEEYKYNYKN
ncbi:RHS repeat domain-containing protein [Tenacibaculum agarivorans]|uniref:RHS repeat domain-containing protein n=1 Tax=Tenacibaculum agarivorans TaxID=1908389 RepID=UPI00094B98CF|nr:RHS repeat domain-containing protein [Tenacibaculum agarivorans]